MTAWRARVHDWLWRVTPQSSTWILLKSVNYRRYIGGQVVSLVGSWMQITGLAWLVLDSTHSGAVLGIVAAAQSLPMLLLAPYAGVLIDRMQTYGLLVRTQLALSGLCALLGALVITHEAKLWYICFIALLLGIFNAADSTGRQAFVRDIAGAASMHDAVAIPTVLNNVARAVGPIAAVLVMGSFGVGWVFIFNAASYVIALLALKSLDRSQLHVSPPQPRKRRQLREGLAYVRQHRALAIPLVVVTLIGTFTYEFQVTLPMLARTSLGVAASGYGVMTASVGVGAMLGGVLIRRYGQLASEHPSATAISFGVAVLGAAAAPNLLFESSALIVVGVASVIFLTSMNSSLQLQSDARYHGRVMGLWSAAFQGSTAIGAPLIGVVGQYGGARAALLVGAAVAIVVGGLLSLPGAWHSQLDARSERVGS